MRAAPAQSVPSGPRYEPNSYVPQCLTEGVARTVSNRSQAPTIVGLPAQPSLHQLTFSTRSRDWRFPVNDARARRNCYASCVVPRYLGRRGGEP
jgi:hypothetical protein